MAYDATWKPEKYTYLKDTFEQILDLPDKASLFVKPNDLEDLNTIKLAIYNWMFHMQIKKFYQVRTLSDQIQVIKIKGKNMVTVSAIPIKNELDNEIMEELIKICSTEEEAFMLLMEKVKSKRIVTSDLDRYLTKWKETMETPEMIEDVEEYIPQGEL